MKEEETIIFGEDVEMVALKVALIPIIFLGYPLAWAFYKFFLEEDEEQEDDL